MALPSIDFSDVRRPFGRRLADVNGPLFDVGGRGGRRGRRGSWLAESPLPSTITDRSACQFHVLFRRVCGVEIEALLELRLMCSADVQFHLRFRWVCKMDFFWPGLGRSVCKMDFFRPGLGGSVCKMEIFLPALRGRMCKMEIFRSLKQKNPMF